MQMKDRFDLTSAPQGVLDLNLSAFGYSPLAPLPVFFFFPSAVSPAWGRSVFGPVACRERVGPEVTREGGDGRNGGGPAGGPVPPQVKPLMEMEPPPLSTQIRATVWLPPPQ